MSLSEIARLEPLDRKPLLGVPPRSPMFASGVGHMRRSDILVTPHIGPVLRQHFPAKRVNFHLPANLKTRSLKPQIEAPDPGE
jgi:hypothetical protein